MVAARFGGSPDDDLSAVNSHRRDHERIVALADAVLNRGEGIIRKKDIDAFASAIARHTENFVDQTYYYFDFPPHYRQ